MPLGRKVDLIPGDIVLDGDPAPPKRATAPQFSAHVCCDQTAEWIRCHYIGTEPEVDHIVLDGDPASAERGTAALSLFSAHVYCGQAYVAHLSYC